MNKDQIREILAGYRPELYQDDDPLISESLQAAKADPELSAWLDYQIAVDREISEQLQSLSPPSDGRKTLLEAYHAQQDEEGFKNKKRSRRFSCKARAIMVLLLLAGAGLVKHFAFPPPVAFAEVANPTSETLREQMAYFASQRFTLDKTFQQQH